MLAALCLGLLAGGFMGNMGISMAFFIKEATQCRSELTAMVPKLYPFITSSYVTYVSLLGASLASGAGFACGHQVYNLKRWNQKDPEASVSTSLALAAFVVVLGVAVSGAAVGAVLEFSFSNFMLMPFSVHSGVAFILGQTVISIVAFALCACSSGFYYGCVSVVILFVLCLLVFLEYALAVLSFSTGSVLFLDMGSMLPLIPPSLVFCVCHKFHQVQLSKAAVKIPTVMIITVLIARTCFHDKDQPSVPFVHPANFTLPDLHVLERFFVILLGLQMFQASCGAVVFSYFVNGAEATEISAGAVSFAAAGILAVLMKVSPMLPAGVLLGGLLAVSGGFGAALIAAGDLGHRYGGHGGRTAAVLIAAVGAFLPLALHNVQFGLMVALCTAAIPASPFVELCLDYIKSCIVCGTSS